MADASGESCLTVSVDRTEGEFISAGSSVEIKASGKTEKICDYTVTDIVENKEDKTLLDIRIHLPGGVLEAGTLAEAEIVRKPENYAALCLWRHFMRRAAVITYWFWRKNRECWEQNWRYGVLMWKYWIKTALPRH